MSCWYMYLLDGRTNGTSCDVYYDNTHEQQNVHQASFKKETKLSQKKADTQHNILKHETGQQIDFRLSSSL